jgi:hypothetical protein
MNAPDPPPAPDPVATSKAQAQSNAATANADQTVKLIDQYTPDGSLIHDKIGFEDVPDGFGGTVRVNRWKATQSLSPEQQRLKDLSNQTSAEIGQIGLDQSKRIGGLLSQPVNLNNEATEARLMDLGRKRLDPAFAQREEALRTRLANSGIRAGTAAFSNEMRGFDEGRNDAYNSLMLQGRAQASQEALTERNQPINEITALMSGSQVTQPQFANVPTSQVAGVDHSGNVYRSYDGQMRAYQAEQANSNAMMGGLFGLAGAGMRFLPGISDRRFKRDVTRFGTGRHGLNLYAWRYMFDPSRVHVGHMADEVRKVMPDAVFDGGGFDVVDYGKLEAA